MQAHFRGGQEWRELDMPLTTGSEEACKLYDAAVTQRLAWYDDYNLGGMEGTLKRMLEADPGFVMGHVVKTWMGVSSNSQHLTDDISRMLNLAETTPGITVREKQHAQAVSLLARQNFEQAAQVYEDILADHPLDSFAASSAFLAHLHSGRSAQLRDCIARVLPYWKPTVPHYGYMLGLYAFGMEETNYYQQAEAAARKALDINARDAWSTHALCHTLEMMGRQVESTQMMEKTQADWEFGSHLACHNYWHWALDNVELGEYETALSILDDQLTKRLSISNSVFALTDVTSLLYRLQMEGVNVGDRWEKMSDMYKEHTDDHSWAFNDLHIFMACLNSKEEGLADKMMTSVHDFIREGKGDARDVMETVGEPLMKALAAYKDGDYAQAVDLMNPIKYRIIAIGGSHAQRDLFNLVLIQAAMRSPRKEHHRLARNLLNERKNLIENSPMTDRLLAKVLELHAD